MIYLGHGTSNEANFQNREEDCINFSLAPGKLSFQRSFCFSFSLSLSFGPAWKIESTDDVFCSSHHHLVSRSIFKCRDVEPLFEKKNRKNLSKNNNLLVGKLFRSQKPAKPLGICGQSVNDLSTGVSRRAPPFDGRLLAHHIVNFGSENKRRTSREHKKGKIHLGIQIQVLF
jgi:hypothetical protein